MKPQMSSKQNHVPLFTSEMGSVIVALCFHFSPTSLLIGDKLWYYQFEFIFIGVIDIDPCRWLSCNVLLEMGVHCSKKCPPDVDIQTCAEKDTTMAEREQILADFQVIFVNLCGFTWPKENGMLLERVLKIQGKTWCAFVPPNCYNFPKLLAQLWMAFCWCHSPIFWTDYKIENETWLCN